MNQSRNAYHHGDLRNALVSAAVQLIEHGGAAAFSLREAARDVGVSANAAYRHFEDKSALMGAAAADGYLQLAARMRSAMGGLPKRPTREPVSVVRFKAVGRAYIEFALERPELFRLMFGECGVFCMGAGGPEPAVETPWVLLGQSLDALVAEGRLAPERRGGAERLAWSAVHGFAALSLAGLDARSDPHERSAALESLLDFVVVGLCGRVA